MWEELGIAPSSDAREIRRAYAQRLRDAHPERDPEAFQRLRSAYERALAWAERGPLDTETSEDESENGDAISDREPPADPRPEQPLRQEFGADTEADALAARFEATLGQEDVEGAFAEFSRGAARGAWSLAEQQEIVAKLMALAVEADRLPAARFAAIAHAVDWDRPIAWEGEEHRALRERVLARLGAERWYGELKAAAASTGGMFGARQQRLIARAFLGRLPRWRMRLVAKQSLQQALEEYERHLPWSQRLVSPEHAQFLTRLRDDFLRSKEAWSGKQKSKRGTGAFQVIFLIAALQALLTLLRECNGN